LIVLHIPHASTKIPDDVRERLLLDETAIETELARMTDWFTDELFGRTVPGAVEVVYPVSRLVADPERFERNEDEPAAEVGMGAIYTRTSGGLPLRGPLSDEERAELLARFYRPHHETLSEAVAEALEQEGRCLLLDCHSFPMRSIPFELSERRPDICLGTDEFHTPQPLLQTAISAFEAQGFIVGVDDPFSGALVPSRFYRREPQVEALMVEVGRWVYMTEESVEKIPTFASVRRRVGAALQAITSSYRRDA